VRAHCCAGAEADANAELSAAPWLDVTVALQYLVEEQALRLPSATPKASLLGFADLAPGAPKTLHVCYLHRHKPFWVERAFLSCLLVCRMLRLLTALLCAVPDDAPVKLPSMLAVPLDDAEAQKLQVLARADRFLPATGS